VGVVVFFAGAAGCQTALAGPGLLLGVGVWGGVWWLWVVCWLLFEMCIVDASIFVVKFVRANGGCLGTRSR
jgi:hypothetical protein